MLLAGSYERFLFGLRVAQAEGENKQQQRLERSFTHAAHKGVVKCLAAAGQYAASGGADDLIHLYDLKKDRDLGFLMSPGEGAVTSLAFFTPAGAYNPTHLLSGSADGSLSVWSVGGGWESMKTMRGHRKEVSCISMHPSGLVALSVSRDCCLRMWDLVKGRCTYTSKLEAEAEAVAFCPEAGGAHYALLCGSRVTLHSVQGDQGVAATLEHPRRVLCMAWAPGNRLVTGSEDGSLRLWDAQAGVELLCINRAHASRVRALALVEGASMGGTSSSRTGSGGSKKQLTAEQQQQEQQEQQQRLLVATCSSDGSVKLWDLTKASAAGVPTGASGGACLAEAQTRARLTCLATADTPAVMQQRQVAAAAARQQHARAAAAAAQQGQGEQQPQPQPQGRGKKRKGSASDGAADAAVSQQKAKKNKRQAAPAAKAEEQQLAGSKPGAGSGKGRGKPGKGKPAAAAAAAGAAEADEGVVVHDGVVEFLDSPEQAQRQKKKQAAVQQKRRAAAENGKRFRSVPGQKHPQQQHQRREQRQQGAGRPKQQRPGGALRKKKSKPSKH